MLKSTISSLACVARKKCKGELSLKDAEGSVEISYGTLECSACQAKYPILAGVAVLVPDVHAYLVYHVKGVSKHVPDQKIPKAYRADFLRAKKELFEELIEEDLESDRVNVLYLMNHYLHVKDSKTTWWIPEEGKGSPEIENLIKTYWDQGPLEAVAKRVKKSGQSVIELGCGVGGLYHRIAPRTSNYLGVDSAFQSIILARHFNLGIPYSGELKIPQDLLNGPLSRKVNFETSKAKTGDFIVGEIDQLPVKRDAWDLSISMNTIDMLEDPRLLAEVQFSLLKKGGEAIQSDPYIWHDRVAKRIRSQLPKTVMNSARAVEHIYEKAGFKMGEIDPHVPWIFFKHLRQVELYSVHVFSATKN